MNVLPGWDSVDSTATVAYGLHITSIYRIGLIELVFAEFDGEKDRVAWRSAVRSWRTPSYGRTVFVGSLMRWAGLAVPPN